MAEVRAKAAHGARALQRLLRRGERGQARPQVVGQAGVLAVDDVEADVRVIDGVGHESRTAVRAPSFRPISLKPGKYPESPL